MPVTYNQLDEAFLGSGLGGDAVAWINRRTGERRLCGSDIDGDEPPPDGDADWLSMPDARELDLKNHLVEAFVAAECPHLAVHVRHCFSRRGAWSAFKNLLDSHDLRDRWHAFEDQARRRALLDWAARQGIEVTAIPGGV